MKRVLLIIIIILMNIINLYSQENILKNKMSSNDIKRNKIFADSLLKYLILITNYNEFRNAKSISIEFNFNYGLLKEFNYYFKSPDKIYYEIYQEALSGNATTLPEMRMKYIFNGDKNVGYFNNKKQNIPNSLAMELFENKNYLKFLKFSYPFIDFFNYPDSSMYNKDKKLFGREFYEILLQTKESTNSALYIDKNNNEIIYMERIGLDDIYFIIDDFNESELFSKPQKFDLVNIEKEKKGELEIEELEINQDIEDNIFEIE